jgi:hypothetical protein
MVSRSVHAGAGDVLVARGAQQPLDLVGRVLIEQNDCVDIGGIYFFTTGHGSGNAGHRLVERAAHHTDQAASDVEGPVHGGARLSAGQFAVSIPWYPDRARAGTRGSTWRNCPSTPDSSTRPPTEHADVPGSLDRALDWATSHDAVIVAGDLDASAIAYLPYLMAKRISGANLPNVTIDHGWRRYCHFVICYGMQHHLCRPPRGLRRTASQHRFNTDW